MENNNQEIKEKVATFRSHYAAMMFRRRYGEGCDLRPVPRSLSSSCGTAAFFKGDEREKCLDENVEGKRRGRVEKNIWRRVKKDLQAW